MTDLAAYHAWNIAAVRFGAPPADLSPEQGVRLAAAVEQAVALEARILETREAAAVMLPIDQIADAAAPHQQFSGHASGKGAVVADIADHPHRIAEVVFRIHQHGRSPQWRGASAASGTNAGSSGNDWNTRKIFSCFGVEVRNA